MENALTKEQAEKLVHKFMAGEKEAVKTQEILDSGEIPRLKGYKVRPGKVSDCIVGGKASYTDKKTGDKVEIENPPLETEEGAPLILMIRTPRISTHDTIRGRIPFKSQIISENHNYMKRLVEFVMPGCEYETGLPEGTPVTAAERLKPIMFENVIRAYNAKSTTTTSLYQSWLRNMKEFCGQPIPKGIIPNGPLPQVMVTPSTKSENDSSVSPTYLHWNGICTTKEFDQIMAASLTAFGVVAEHLRQKGIILVDTKTEHGKDKKGQIRVMDELYTLDSSRFWNREDHEQQMERYRAGNLKEIEPKALSKEFARQYSKGKEGYTDEQRAAIAVRYIEGYQQVLGKRFQPDMRPWEERVVEGLEKVVERLIET